MPTIAPPVPDSILARDRARDSVMYTNLKKRMEKRGVTRELYNFLFRDVYNSRADEEVKTLDEHPFLPFEGRIIRHIVIRRLDVFGTTVYDTLRKPGSWLERVGNRLHTDTRESVIRNSFLLFKENDKVDPELLRNNERLLRSSNIFHDARIIVIPYERDPRIVDVLILTQDVWSLLPDGGVGGLDNFQLTLEQRNFLGRAHSFSNTIRFDGKDPYQRFEFQSIYRVPYIKRTFITGEAGFQWLRYIKGSYVSAYRPFLTPESKWAGNAILGYQALRNQVFLNPNTDTVTIIPVNYAYGDIWIGRAFKLNFLKGLSDDFRLRSRLILALRSTAYHFTRRPEVTLDTNQLYTNSRSALFSVGFTNRDYKRDLLVYGYGRTEDVPVGYLAQLVTGIETAEFGGRNYVSLKVARGAYFRKRAGYLYSLLNFGGYFRHGNVEQGVLNLEANYFSPLMTWGRSSFRQFVNFRYTTGINRFDYEYINVSNQNGLLGISTDLLRGTHRLTAGFETVFFSPFNILGFRVAMFALANFALLNDSNNSLFNSPVYQGYGLGFRLRNENLTFNTIQIRLSYYPNIPGNFHPYRVEVSGETPLRFNDFNFDRPEYRSDGFQSSR